MRCQKSLLGTVKGLATGDFVQTSDEPLILSLETTTRACSIALTHGASVLSMRTGETQSTHSTDLLENIRAVLIDARLEIDDVKLYAVASGPGSFTGLRIGLATAKAFAATLRKPLFGVPTLYSIARAAGPSNCTLAMIPAGRGEVFGQLLTVDLEGVVSPLREPVHLPPERLLQSLDEKRRLKLAGDGALLYADLIEAHALQSGVTIVNEERELRVVENDDKRWMAAFPIENLAMHVAAEAWRRFQIGESGDPALLRAIYVRASDAELNEQWREQSQPAG